MGYCEVDDVKRVLRVLEPATNNQYKVRMSDSYTLPESYSSNGSDDLYLKGITSIKSDYAGSEQWIIEFTSSTGFTLYRGEEQNVSDGSGVVGTNFTSTSGIITINSTEWVGTAQTGDKIKFRTDSNISEDDADEFIVDADTVLEGIINKKMDISSLPDGDDVPPLIARSSMYLTSYFIFQSIYSSINKDQLPSVINKWYKFATDLVGMYLDSITGKSLAKYAHYGRFVSRDTLFPTVGIAETSGVEGLSGEIEAVDVEYDKDFNSKESIGST